MFTHPIFYYRANKKISAHVTSTAVFLHCISTVNSLAMDLQYEYFYNINACITS